MILVQVFAVVREDQVRRNLATQLLDVLFDPPAHKREVTVAKLLDHNPLRMCAPQENLCAAFGLAGARGCGAEDAPMDGDVGILFGELQERAATTDLDVVSVRTQ